MVRVTAEDGFTFDAYEARPEAGSKGGLVILQEIFGVTDQMKSVARKYAEQGYDAIVPALFDRAAPKTVVPFSEGPRGLEIAKSLNPDQTKMDIAASAKAVDTGKGVSVLGFCLGGGQALRMAQGLELTSAIAFYGTRLQTILGAPLKCPMMFHFGETDDHSPPEVIEAVRVAIPEAEIHLYPAGHAFANDARDTYVADAAKLAHERTITFLNKHHNA